MKTIVDDSSHTTKFSRICFSKPCRHDTSSNGGIIQLYVRNNIPSGLLTDYKMKDHLKYFSCKYTFEIKSDYSATLIANKKIFLTTYSI